MSTCALRGSDVFTSASGGVYLCDFINYNMPGSVSCTKSEMGAAAQFGQQCTVLAGVSGLSLAPPCDDQLRSLALAVNVQGSNGSPGYTSTYGSPPGQGGAGASLSGTLPIDTFTASNSLMMVFDTNQQGGPIRGEPMQGGYGGGYSAISTSSAPLAIAGGGGGGGDNTVSGGSAGIGSNPIGAGGGDGFGGYFPGGNGGTLTYAGRGGSSPSPNDFGGGYAGLGRSGGDGGDSPQYGGSSGGGGAGLWGGGGGSGFGSGGGGGSSLIPAGFTSGPASSTAGFVTFSFLAQNCVHLSGSLRARAKRTQLSLNYQVTRDCPASQQACKLPSGDFECIDNFETCDS